MYALKGDVAALSALVIVAAGGSSGSKPLVEARR